MTIGLKWVGAFDDASGYGSSTRSYIEALLKRKDISLTVTGVSFERDKTSHGTFKDHIVPLLNKNVAHKIQVVHLTPENYVSFKLNSLYNIGLTTWETDKLPSFWTALCNNMEEIWVPSTWNKKVFQDSGVVCPINVIPHGIPIVDLADIEEVALDINPETYVFYTIFQWCYDNKTRVLTREGFKYFKDLLYTDEIATLNKETDILEYHKPEQIVSFPRHDKMLQVSGQLFNQCITPDHKLVVKSRGHSSWQLLPANELLVKKKNGHKGFAGKWRTKKNCIWQGIEQSYFELPNYNSIGISPASPKTFSMDIFLEFLGWWISEGCAYKAMYKGKINGYRIEISQTKSEIYKDEIRLCVNNLGFPGSWSGGHYIFYSREIYYFLRQFGYAQNKFIPTWVKGLSTRQIKILLTSLFKGDGTIAKDESWVKYTTTSKQLAEDLLECLLKIGYSGAISTEDPTKKKPGCIDGRLIKGALPQYTVSINKYRNEPALYDAKVELIDYDGIVYCASVPNHTMFIEREGKVCWSGNTERKNPAGLLKAYLSEFGPNEDVCLVLKTYRLNTSLAEQGAIKQDIVNIKKAMRLDNFPKMRFLGDLLSSGQMKGLHNRGDCLLSPHHAEGFSLGCAEAMSFGKPVIATGYSGNLDFMNNDNSYLIKYQETPVYNMLFQHYNGLMTWGDPNLSHMKKLMRYCFEHQDKAKLKGIQAKKDIQEKFSWDVVGDIIVKRLQEIEAKL